MNWNNVRIALFFAFLLGLLPGCIYRSFLPEDLSLWSDSSRNKRDVYLKPEVEMRAQDDLLAPSVVSLRMRNGVLPAPTPISNDFVLQQEKLLRRHNNRFVRHALARKARYKGLLERTLESYGVPRQLIALAVIESGMKEKIRSRSGAVGLWQFMRPTAKKYGLRISLFQDDRKDPLKSTQAAARYLLDLYAQYNDWSLALAAYNAGETRVNSILRDEGKTDFWELARAGRFPKQTRVHVYKFFAVLNILATHDQSPRG